MSPFGVQTKWDGAMVFDKKYRAKKAASRGVKQSVAERLLNISPIPINRHPWQLLRYKGHTNRTEPSQSVTLCVSQQFSCAVLHASSRVPVPVCGSQHQPHHHGAVHALRSSPSGLAYGLARPGCLFSPFDSVIYSHDCFSNLLLKSQ